MDIKSIKFKGYEQGAEEGKADKRVCLSRLEANVESFVLSQGYWGKN